MFYEKYVFNLYYLSKKFHFKKTIFFAYAYLMFVVFCDIKQYGVTCVDMNSDLCRENRSDKRIDIKSQT